MKLNCSTTNVIDIPSLLTLRAFVLSLIFAWGILPVPSSSLMYILDECNSLELEKFLRSLKQLRDRNIKLLCTSRPHITDIDNWVEMTSSLEIFAHDDDIRNYLSHRMDKEWKFSDRLQRQVMEQLLINAQGKSHRIFYDH
jgi:hypothetical protein